MEIPRYEETAAKSAVLLPDVQFTQIEKIKDKDK
jgi:hypothetical protein